MGLTYFKRFRMEREVSAATVRPPTLPAGYRLVSWSPALLGAHAEAKHRSFCFELDANVFPCLGDRDGCYRLMNAIVSRSGFLPGATWLAQWQDRQGDPWEPCGTVQAVCIREGVGSVQNLGIVPEHRGRGLGACLMEAALIGFWEAGLERASLEVTAQNVGAVRLYERLGFRRIKTVYRAGEVACA